jgi:hypothetical protein
MDDLAYKNYELRPLNKYFFRHSGLDPESRKSLKPLDPPVKPGDDDTTIYTVNRVVLRYVKRSGC